MRRLLVIAFLCALSAGCADDQGKGDMHVAVSHCLAHYSFRKGSAYDRFSCIAGAHFRYGPNAVGTDYDLVSQIDMASLRIGLDVDAGTLSVPEAETELHWVTTKAQDQAHQRSNTDSPAAQAKTQPPMDDKKPPTAVSAQSAQPAAAEPISQTAGSSTGNLLNASGAK